MKAILCMVFLVAGFCSVAFGQQQQFKKGTVEDELVRLDKAWTSAELKGDAKTVGAMLADDFVGTTQRGEIQSKADYVAGVSPNADMVRADDYKISVYGDTAIMTHRSTVQGVRNMQYRSTHVWMKRKGKWLIVAHHGSRIMPPDDDKDTEDPDK